MPLTVKLTVNADAVLPVRVTVNTPMSTPYNMFSGSSTLVPALVNIPGQIDWMTVTAVANASPLALVTVKRPDGSEVPVPPVDRGSYRINDLADGRYEVTAVDKAGNRTFAAFSLGSSALTAKPESSRSVYVGDLFGAQFKFGLSDYYPLEKAELFDGGGALLRTDPLSTNNSEITYSLPDLFSPLDFKRDVLTDPAFKLYKVKMSDREGHQRDEDFALGLAVKGLYGDGTIDLLGEYPGLLSGARGYATGIGAGASVDTLSAASGPIVNVQQAGYCELTVLTGEKADLSDAVEKSLGTRSIYYSVWNSQAAPPDGCTPVVSSMTVCYNETLHPPTELKRYNRMKLTAYPAPQVGVFKYFCQSSSNSYCYAGHWTKLEADVMSEQMVAWGVSYTDRGGGVYGGLSAQVPAGSNVTVKLADWLSLTFPEVTTPGSVSANLVSFPSLPGVLALRSIFLGTDGQLRYNGDIQVAVKYDGAGVTDGQLAFMAGLKVNDIAKRDVSISPALVDKAKNTAVFSTPELGSFVLEVPAYPSPYNYAMGAGPELALLGGVPGVTMEMIGAGSALEQNYLEMLRKRGLVPAGNAYLLGPTGQQFPIPAAITMLYDKASISAKKLLEQTLAIYQQSEDGKFFSKLGNSVLNMDKGVITAEVSEFHSIFVIAGSTEPAQPLPLSPDVTPPVTNLAFGIPAFETGGLVMISSASPVFVDAYDPSAAGNITSGRATSYYLIDVAPDSCVGEPAFTGPSGTCLNPLYTAPFTLPAGIHTLWYKSYDYVGNSETEKSKTLYVDGAAPLVTVSAAGQEVAAEGTAYITEADSITLTSIDPALSGPVSGVGMTVFDISTTPCTGFTDYPQNPGDCRKILYTGAFALPEGEHTLYYSAMDNVGNMAAVKRIIVNVPSKGATPQECALRAAEFYKRFTQSLHGEALKR